MRRTRRTVAEPGSTPAPAPSPQLRASVVLLVVALVVCPAAASIHLPCVGLPPAAALAEPAPASFPDRLSMARALLPASGSALAEVGVFAGEFAEALHDAVRPSSLVLVDPWPPGEAIMSGDADGNNLREVSADALYARVRERLGGRPGVAVHRATAEAVLPRLPRASLDAVYVDGDHTYGGCVRDLLLAACVVRPGGLLMGHDFAMNAQKTSANYSFGVKAAVATLVRVTGRPVIALGMDGCVSYAIRM